MKIAITGNIGSGKSTVLKLLQKTFPLIPIFSIDSLVHEIVELDEVIEFNKKTFNTTIRSEISKIAFLPENKHKLIALEKFTAPFIISKLEQIFNNNKHIIIEVPLLYEQKLEYLFDKSILITASEETRILRAMKRDNKTKEQIQLIMNNQMKQEEKIKLVNFIYENENNSNQDKLISYIQEQFKYNRETTIKP